jgi:hypothetical protein
VVSALRKEIDVVCPNCGKELSPIYGQKFCSFCGGSLEKPETASEPLEPASIPEEERPGPESEEVFRAREEYCPWEDYGRLGFFQGLKLTLKQSLFSPRPFFSRLPRSGGLLVPLLYGMVVETAGTYGGYLWSFIFGNPVFSQGKPDGSMAIIFGVLVPLLVFFSLVAGALILHVCILLVGAAKEDFEATFRIACYTSGPDLLNAIPVVGIWIAAIWRIYLTVVAVREVHETSTAKAVVAVLLPAIACCGLLVGGGVLLVMALGLSGGS